MLYELSNGAIQLKISAKGAEMCSVYSHELNKEILWQADPAVWARHAPVLFPIVGRLKNDSYTYKGQSYSLPQHGFARDKEFTVSERSDSHLVFELKEDEESLKRFPFRFLLRITYRLEARSVHCNYSVQNPMDEDLYFSIGAHPGFICPLFEEESFADYDLAFHHHETAERILLQEGLLSGTTEPVITEHSTIPLDKNLFEKDAIVLKDLQSDLLKLRSSRYTLYFDWHNMPYYGIWAKKGNASFICLEPWAGVADHSNASGNLEEKEGIIRLKARQQYDCGFSFTPLHTDQK